MMNHFHSSAVGIGCPADGLRLYFEEWYCSLRVASVKDSEQNGQIQSDQRTQHPAVQPQDTADIRGDLFQVENFLFVT